MGFNVISNNEFQASQADSLSGIWAIESDVVVIQRLVKAWDGDDGVACGLALMKCE